MLREEAYEHLLNRITSVNLIKHSIAVEAIMRKFAAYYNEDIELWGLAGLLHDIDYETTCDNPSRHGLVSADILEGLGVDEAIIYSIKAHNDFHKIERKRKLDKVLFSADPVSGLIIAGALILPEKKIANVTVDFLIRRMDEKSFAKGADREQIKSCKELDISLDTFLSISLSALNKISDELGL
jgi:putative nucleotidyltransferase with HDIG domain